MSIILRDIICRIDNRIEYNEHNNGYILPQPVIVDGWHRYVTARWLFDQASYLKYIAGTVGGWMC